MTEGEKACTAVLVVAGVYDVWALATNRETISEAVYRHRKWARYLNVYLVLHFEHIIPNKYDPLRRFFR